MTHYRILLPYFRRNLGILAIGVSSLLIVDLLQLFIPRVIKLAVDDLTRYQATSARLLSYAGMVLALALGIVVFRFVWRRCLFGHSRQVEEALRNRLFSHLQTLSFSYFDRANTGDLMAHATNDVQAVQLAAGMGLVALTDTLVLGTAAIGFMLYINPSLTLIALLPMPFIALFARTISKIFYERFQKVQASFSQLTERARENLAGIRTIKAYTQETAEIKRFDQTGRNYIAANLRMVKISGFFSPMSLIFTNISMALVLVIGGKLTILNTISVGDFVAFNSYLLLLTWPMMALGWMINLFQRGSASLGRIQAILNTTSEAAEIVEVPKKSLTQGDIESRSLTFTYPGSNLSALEDIHLSIKPGQLVGIVGRTGAGKSTLCQLLPRLYDTPPGQLYLEGEDIHRWPLDELRRAIAVVPQDPFIFADTVRANICFGNPDASTDEMIEAAEAAHLLDEILALPHQFDTILGERGVTLSGGQKQRLTLARALILSTPLLILDDCFSSVDLETELAILANLRHYLKARTTLIASHRLEAMRAADMIFVLEWGRLREQGNHDQLLAQKGIYAALYHRQKLEVELYEEAGSGKR
ncbi:MAG: multidrug ABC transporter ATP-binding protein [Desulfobacteraceae bacterium]|nr:MAG: multidrug ABC transporter ATP-binding protein [Desulfobacteraceae bacterium]